MADNQTGRNGSSTHPLPRLRGALMYRSIDAGTWADPWFSELEPDAKLLFLYLLTNDRTTACGAYEINVKRIAFETSMSPVIVRTLLRSFAPRVVWWPDADVIWVRNFFRRQNKNANDKMLTSARRSLDRFPAEVKHAVYSEYPELNDGTVEIPATYPMDRVSIPSDSYTVNSTDTEQVQEQQQEERVTAPAAADLPVVEIDMTELDRKVAGIVRQVRGMAGVSESDIVLHLRDVLAIRGAPLTAETLVAETLKFRDYHNEKRRTRPVSEKWRGWKVAATNWFERVNEAPRTMNGTRHDARRETNLDNIMAGTQRAFQKRSA